jgi:hypothetical protein
MNRDAESLLADTAALAQLTFASFGFSVAYSETNPLSFEEVKPLLRGRVSDARVSVTTSPSSRKSLSKVPNCREAGPARRLIPMT